MELLLHFIISYCHFQIIINTSILANELKNGDNYRDGNKSPETIFNKVYAHGSKTEQASETMTPALYRCTIYNRL